jgi:hypothetical protein
MTKLTRPVRIIEELLAAEQRLATALGDEWPSFMAKLQQQLVAMQDLETVDKIDQAVTQLLFLGWETPAWPIFQEIMQATDKGDSLATTPRLKSPFTLRGALPAEETTAAGVGESLSLTDFHAGVAQAVARWQKPVTPTGAEEAATLEAVTKSLTEAAERYLNAGFFHDDLYVKPDQPLVRAHAPYQLRVNIGTFWGPGTPGNAFPQSLVEPYFDDMLPLTIAVTNASPGLDVTPAHQPLDLPRQGDSDYVTFTITPTRTGINALVVDVLYAGHLLQSRRLTTRTVAAPGDTLPPSAWPVQDGHTTFTRTTALHPDQIADLAQQPRPLTIVSEREPQLNSIGLRFFDHTGVQLAFRTTTLQEANLTRLLDTLRAQLKQLMVSYAKAGTSGPDTATYTRRLAKLGQYGRSLYRAILPGYQADDWQTESGQWLQAALRPGAVIQIAPLTTGLSMPWEMLYERPLHSYDPDQTRICPAYSDHGPLATDCPHHDDGHVLCPHGFWGYRYIIEQLPGRLTPGQPPPTRTLPQWIRNPIPAALSGLVYTAFWDLPHHWQRLQKLVPADRFRLRQLNTRVLVNDFMSGKATEEPQPSLIYVYAHGGEDAGMPCLQVVDKLFITSNDLDAWGTDWRTTTPLLLINACGSADYSPDSFENLIQDFYRRGAAGILGTQCPIYEELVDKMMIPFLEAFLRQVPAGQALLDARRQLLFQEGDVRGLVYSLFAAAELQLAEPVVVLPVEE